MFLYAITRLSRLSIIFQMNKVKLHTLSHAENIPHTLPAHYGDNEKLPSCDGSFDSYLFYYSCFPEISF